MQKFSAYNAAYTLFDILIECYEDVSGNEIRSVVFGARHDLQWVNQN